MGGASSFVEIAVPMGVSASVNTGGWMGCTNELASLDMYWLVFYPQPPPSLTPYFHVINWGYAHQSSSTGGWRFSCTGNGLPPPQSPPPLNPEFTLVSTSKQFAVGDGGGTPFS